MTLHHPKGCLSYLTFAKHYSDHFAKFQKHIIKEEGGGGAEEAYMLLATGLPVRKHFLSDLFASGHFRQPRHALAAAPSISKSMHGNDNELGFAVQNKRGNSGTPRATDATSLMPRQRIAASTWRP